MATLTQRIKNKLYRDELHPYRLYEGVIGDLLHPDATLLDAGCGRGAPTLLHFRDRCAHMIGIDVVEPLPEALEAGVEYHTCLVADAGLADEIADVIISRSVFEHLEDPSADVGEMARMLRPGGSIVVLTPNLGDYVSVVSKVVPNRLHPWIVRVTEGRAEEDTFPTYYRANTKRAFRKLAKAHGLTVTSAQYLSQYPAAFMFNPILFTLAAGYEKVVANVPFLSFLRGWILAVLRKPATTEAPQADAAPDHARIA